MLRLFYCCALRLHPPAFRRRFAEEMLSIFDQSQGRLAALRLLLDGIISLARQWTLRPDFWHEIPAAAATHPAADGIPSFCTIRPFRPRGAAVLHGLVLTAAVFCTTCFAIRYSWIHVLHISIPELSLESSSGIPPAGGYSPTWSTPVPESGASRAEPVPVASEEQSAPPITSSGSHKNPSSIPANSKPKQVSQAGNSSQPQEADRMALAPGGSSPVAAESSVVDASERQRVIQGAIANLAKYYVDPTMAQKIVAALSRYDETVTRQALPKGNTFAAQLTAEIMNVSHDPYIVVIYSSDWIAETPPAPTAEDMAAYRRHMENTNCTFERSEVLPHNIGYLKFNSFPDASICGPTAAAALKKLNNVDAIIFDLRDNPGGYANMVALIATYLFDRPTHLNDFYNRADNSTEQSWTLPPIPGNKLAGKPAFILTSSKTFSAAEAFSYDLKMLKRATLVGETTSGRGHMGALHTIDEHFGIRIPSIRVVNPVSKTNWDGTGVEPDVKVSASQALQTAQRLAEAGLQKGSQAK